MPSTYTTSLRFTLEASGENVNTWGTLLNTGAITLTDTAIAGWLTKALTTSYALTTANGATDEARNAMLKFTGTGAFTVTIPSVSKTYHVWNACTGALTITTGSGATAILQSGEIVSVICDATNVYRVQPTDFGSQRITSVLDPTSNQDAATKKYVDDTAFTMAAGSLPAQTGHAGHVLLTDATTAAWGGLKFTQAATSGQLQLLESDQATVLGGLVSDSSGHVSLVNSAGGNRLVTNTDGTASLVADVGTSNLILTAADYGAAADVRAGSSTTKVPTANALITSAAVLTLTDAATIAWDTASGFNATVTLTASGHTVGAPTNLHDGLTYSLELVQGGTGSNAVTWDTIWDFGAYGTPSLQTTVGKADKVFAQYNSRTGKLDATFRQGA